MLRDFRQAALDLEEWVQRNGYAGYDPFDLQTSGAGNKAVSLSQGSLKAVIRPAAKAVKALDAAFPMLYRKLFTRKKEYSTAVCLIGHSQLRLHRITK
ncbi:MAG: hypothetical protein AB1626_03350, partial [Candidatus Micrarchaeota archaeon]